MTDSWISPKARIGANVAIGAGCRIHDGVVIGDDCTIGDLCVLGLPAGEDAGPLEIGARSTIRSHGVLYRGSTLGPELQTGHHVLVRDGARIGRRFRIGSYGDIEGDCVIGDYTSCHGFVQIGRGSRIGSFVWIYSQVILTNDPLPPSHVFRPVTLEDGVVVCVNATVLPGAVMRKGSYAAAQAMVQGEVPPGAIVSGPEGRVAGHVTTLFDFASGTRHPWMRHFKDAYPESAWPAIETLALEIARSRT